MEVAFVNLIKTGVLDVQNSNAQIQSFMVQIVMKSAPVQEGNAISLASVDNASKIILDQNVKNVSAKMGEFVNAINVCALKTSTGYCVKLGLRNAEMVFMTIIPKNVFVLKFIVVYFVDIANVKTMVFVPIINVSVLLTMVEHFVKHVSASIMEHVSQIDAIVLPIFTGIFAKINCV
jgi:hypothetical protein